MKDFMKRIIFPHKFIGFIFFNLGFGLLIYVFLNQLEETPIAYVSYVLSTHALTIFCAWFYKVCKSGASTIKKSKAYHLYQKNSRTVTKTSLYTSIIMSLICGLFKLSIGIYYKSWWFITFASYYFFLFLMRLSLVKNTSDREQANKKLKHTGILLLLFNLILTGIIVLIIKRDQIISYDGYLIYLVALYDFYLITSAIVNVIKQRNNHNPIITASKYINLTVTRIDGLSRSRDGLSIWQQRLQIQAYNDCLDGPRHFFN